MFGKSSAVPVLLWLLVVSFFNQIEGNNPVSSNSSKVSPLEERKLGFFISLLVHFLHVQKNSRLLIRDGRKIVKNSFYRSDFALR